MNSYATIKIKSLKYLIAIINDKKDINIIKWIYNQSFSGFDNHINFLRSTNIIKKNYIFNNYYLNQNINFNNLEIEIIRLLKYNKEEFGTIFRKFLKNFKKYDKKYKAIINDRKALSSFKDIRFFLYDMKILNNIYHPGVYEINADYNKYIFSNVLSLVDFKKKLKNQELLGENAEREIISYEKKRVEKFLDISPKRKNHENLPVIQVSKINVLEGYDIQSWTYENGLLKKRFIEVKAVSAIDMQFHWSTNEINIAQDLSSDYYLYLLPVIGNNIFDIKSLKIISNPYKNVVENNLEWNKKGDGLLVTKK